jgi:hypothetical protein
MPIIQYLPDGKEIEIEEGETILQAAVRAGIALAHGDAPENFLNGGTTLDLSPGNGLCQFR